MIFSNKIYKITSGENATLYSKNEYELILFLFNKTLKKYIISLTLDKKCVFQNDYNYDKIIQINQNQLALASNGYITLSNQNET